MDNLCLAIKKNNGIYCPQTDTFSCYGIYNVAVHLMVRLISAREINHGSFII